MGHGPLQAIEDVIRIVLCQGAVHGQGNVLLKQGLGARQVPLPGAENALEDPGQGCS